MARTLADLAGGVPIRPVDLAEAIQYQTSGQETVQETTQEKVLALLHAQPSLMRRALASRLGLSDSGIKYHLKKMKAAGVIRHVGATKSGHWEVLK